jgi:DNA-binding response OmpR family regulator
MAENRILIFWDNDKDIVNMFTYFFREHGFFADSVNSFEECLEFCSKTPPSVLIIDRSPFQSGNVLSFVREIRSNSNISYFPIIVGGTNFTINKKADGYTEVFAAGANACFGHVFDITDVLEQVNTLIEDPTTKELVDKQYLQRHGKSKLD